MGSLLVVRENAAWIPQAATFETILRLIADELENENAALAGQVREDITSLHVYLDSLDEDEFRYLVAAATRAYERQISECLKTKIAAWPKVNLLAFSELKSLLVTDERAGVVSDKFTGTIVIRDQAVWEAPSWVYDLVLEIIAERILEDDIPLTTLLLDSRTLKGKALCDLRSLDNAKFSLLIAPMWWMRGAYVESKVSRALAPELNNAELFPRIDLLCSLFQSDTRLNKEDWSDEYYVKFIASRARRFNDWQGQER